MYNKAQQDLILQLEYCGYPKEFGEIIVSQLHSEKALYRMTMYLRYAKPSSMEEIADELLSIIEENNTWKEKKINQYCNRVMNGMMLYGLEGSEIDNSDDSKDI